MDMNNIDWEADWAFNILEGLPTNEPTCIYRAFGNIELKVPADMVACAGAWDDSAAHYGPVLSDLNQDVSADDLKRELGEYGIEPEKYSMDHEAWEYASWLIACDRREEMA